MPHASLVETASPRCWAEHILFFKLVETVIAIGQNDLRAYASGEDGDTHELRVITVAHSFLVRQVVGNSPIQSQHRQYHG
jgi:hypothetical protein